MPAPADPGARDFAHAELDRLWLTDINEHPTGGGNVYCAVIGLCRAAEERCCCRWAVGQLETASREASDLVFTGVVRVNRLS